MDLIVPSSHAASLGRRAQDAETAARELVRFGETDPDLAADCRVDLGSLEARIILSGGACRRIAEAAGRQAGTVRAEDLDVLARLEDVVARSRDRIGVRLAAMDAAQAAAPIETLGSIIGFATTAVGLIKSIF